MYRALLIGIVLFGACCAPAPAVTEFCPAHDTQMQNPATTPDPNQRSGDVTTETASSAYTYTLDAETPRTLVRAAMIADTDDGWYGWRAENVPLARTSEKVQNGPVLATVTFARSAALAVTFLQTRS